MATTGPRYDKELQEFLDTHPEVEQQSLVADGIASLREGFVSGGSSALLSGRNLDLTEWSASSRDGTDIAMTTIRKTASPKPQAALFHIHSGGMIAGDRYIGMDLMADWVERHDLICATVEYRKAPENPYPTPLEDCFDGLLAFQATLDPNTPLVVAGMSAGGGLSAGVAQMARDIGGPKLAGQLLMCPMLDSRNSSPSSEQFQHIGLWDKQSNDTGWNAYLGARRDSGEIPPYGSPALQTNLTNLPPTFLDVGTLEVFRSEVISYAEALAQADVQVELHMWMGAFHGFDLTHPDAVISHEAMDAREQWLLRLLKGHV